MGEDAGTFGTLLQIPETASLFLAVGFSVGCWKVQANYEEINSIPKLKSISFGYKIALW